MFASGPQQKVLIQTPYRNARPIVPKIKNPRKLTIFSWAGRDLKRDLNIFLNAGIFFTFLREPNISIVRRMERLTIPGIKVIRPKKTTRKSTTFHASFR